MAAVLPKSPAKTRRKAKNVLSSSHPVAEVLTLRETAKYLRVSTDEVLRLVKEQTLPGRRIGSDWRFLKSAVQEWLTIPDSERARAAFGSLIGSWANDPTVEPMLSAIYQRRGRPMVEESP